MKYLVDVYWILENSTVAGAGSSNMIGLLVEEVVYVVILFSVGKLLVIGA